MIRLLERPKLPICTREAVSPRLRNDMDLGLLYDGSSNRELSISVADHLGSAINKEEREGVREREGEREREREREREKK